ncbi:MULTISPECIES: transketolase [Enterocloster]|uniref:Transketolase n=1 Tax=Enterocloster lavalensis TaxID=460384 RepID=A0A1I0HT71_9FIRM|nr:MULTISPECIES: transketolase [Enterocloster]MDR3757926.1 transketolase [Enterocloster sp.]PST32231.1 transketolase [Enterocloster lavalensis]SET87256.1 transketolase [Enterocloster lavalensis]
MTDIKQLKLTANRNRKRIVEMVYQAGVGHVGGALSVIDLLTAIYELEVDFSEEKRTRVVLSKGHATPALYAELAQKGIIDEKDFPTFRQINSRLQGHPYTCDIPQVDATTGLLGQGFSTALGMALVKKREQDPHRVYAIAGDGETQEGQIWEALMMAAHYKLDNLVYIFDYNKLSSGHPTNEVINLEPLADKLAAFNYHVIVIDGNDMEQVVNALKEVRTVSGRPVAIVANTVKGKGVSFMENVPKWHSSGLTDAEYETAMRDLSAREEEICNEL